MEKVDEEYFVHSRENRDEMGGGREDLGEYPSDRNPSTPLDPGRHSLGHTSEAGGAHAGTE